jgi:biopolymer transport protein ExbB/TolQ
MDMQHGPLSKLALYIARAVLILLVVLGLSICFVTFFRSRLVKREEANVDAMRGSLIQAVSHPHKAHEVVDHADGRTVAGRLVKTGFENMELAPEALEQVMVAQESVEQRYLSKGMNFLGTVAANAAFIGLLGTVCGILDAFAHLGEGGEDAAQMVMAAIAEALIATAMGLAVAIPAVVFYNNLSHRVKKVVAEARELRHLILAFGLDAVARKSENRHPAHSASEGVYGG